MATVRLAPDALLTNLNLSGTLAAIQDDPDAPDTAWLTAVDSSAATDLRTSFPTPGTGTVELGTGQEFRVLVRRVGGTDNPPCNLELWVNGAVHTTFPAVTIASTTGEILAATWDGTGIDAANVELRVNSPSTGGSPKTRATCDMGAVEWNAVYVDVVPVNVAPARVGFSVSTPPDKSNHSYGATGAKSSEGAGKLTVTLHQGATEIASNTVSLTATETDHTFLLTQAQADAITDYSTLELRPSAAKSSSPLNVTVQELWIKTPTPSGGGEPVVHKLPWKGTGTARTWLGSAPDTWLGV